MKCHYVKNGKCINKMIKFGPLKCSGRFSNENKYCYTPDDVIK